MKLLSAIICLSIAASILLASIGVSAAGVKVPAPEPVKADMLVGTYYFPGWNQEDRWYCMAANDKVQHPLLGYYREGDPNVADWHIKWALEHGVNFFAFDFYSAGGSQMLESALDGFMKSKYIGQFKFCLNWCNHASWETMTAKELEQFGDLVIKKYLVHPSYLKIDGKPVVIFLAGYSFVKNMGVEKARAEFDKFKARCKDAGLNGAYIVFCEGETNGPDALKDSKAAGADVFCLYNYPYAGSGMTGPGKYAEFTYQHLMEQGEGIWKSWGAMTEGDFWPTVMPGWDRRPWLKNADLLRTGSTPELFGKFLRNARNYVNKDRVVMIEAWNEWGEGSILEPSIEYKFAYLDKVREVFCPNAPKHKDIDPRSLGANAVYKLDLPAIDDWRFNFDIGGWSGANTTPLTQGWGALIMKSKNDDPQISSPKTYLKCSQYPKLHIRMMLPKQEGDSSTGYGQVFWSTADRSMSEETSMQFPVYLDGLWHDYTIDLSSSPTWKGTTDQIRIDPVDKADTEIRIDEIIFMRR